MKSRASLMAMLAIAAGTLLGAASGCELIAGVDRSKIEGAGAGGTGGSTAGGGTGGTGGTTTPTGGGGTGGTTTCDPAKCPVPADECKVAICDAMDMCAEGPAADGKVSATQIVGDCKQNVCMGGAIVSQNLDTDIEDDNQTCTADTCDAGAAQHKPNPQGTSCTENNDDESLNNTVGLPGGNPVSVGISDARSGNDLGVSDFGITIAGLQEGSYSLTLAATSSVNVVQRVPEPGVLSLLGAGLAGFGLIRRRKSRKS